jgi:type II secretion system protein H
MRVSSNYGGGVSASGFSLVELMVVIVIMAILSAAIIPEMRGTYGDALLRSSARNLVDEFGLAYSHAVSKNENCHVEFDIRTHRYSIKSGEAGAPRKPGRATQNEEIAGSSGKLDSRISIRLRPYHPGAPEPADYPRAASEPADSGADLPSGSESDSAAATAASDETPNAEPARANAPGPRSREDSVTFYSDGTADAREVILEDRDGYRMAIRINPVTARVAVSDLEAAR